MYEKRIMKTPEQLRDEATKFAKDDLRAMYPSCEPEMHMPEVLQRQFQWRYARLEEEATQWYSMGMPVAAPVPFPQHPVFVTHPTAVVGQPHVCEPIGEGMSAMPSCRVCGRMLLETKPIVTVGP